MKPTPEDYSISPEEALEINAKSTQGHWQAYGYVGRASGHERYGNVAGLPRVQVDRDAMFTPEDAAAIAWWHNNGPAIARRLMELEEAVLELHRIDMIVNGPSCESDVAKMKKLESIAERIKAGRAAQDG